MDKRELANALRERLLSKRLVSKEILAKVTDDDVIESYVTCSGCGAASVPLDALPSYIDEACCVETFLDSTEPKCHE